MVYQACENVEEFILPPSQQQKVNRNGQKKAQTRCEKGHRGTSRPRREPDEIIECRVSQCQACGTDLSDLLQHVAARHQVLDIPPLQAIVREVVYYGRYCPSLPEVSKGRSAARL
ncbi:MAG: IS66 family transposase zinc-finger binding domain-containing protein [Anaerolineae bacterium]|nr:IS66 family transposase zinc-finger binding domain-containing protein [Anaerolineae bacterium]